MSADFQPIGFRVIAPQAVGDANLLSTNVVEVAPALYSSGSTYAVGATASVQKAGNAIDIYTSLLDANVDHDPTASPTWWKRTGYTFGVYDATATYADGDMVVDPATHLIFVGVGDGNHENPLPLAPAQSNSFWVQVRASNPYAMFDQSNSTQTIAPDLVHVSVRADGMVNGVAVRNASCASVRVVQTDDIEGVVLDQTFDMLSYSGINDFYPWFFNPPRRANYLPIVDLLPYADSTIDLYFSDPGSDVTVGVACLGMIEEVGGTQWDPKVGYTDFSNIAPNDYGDRVIQQRNYSDDGDFAIWVVNDNLDSVMQFFKDRRATALLFQADPRWGAMQIFGIVTDCSAGVPVDAVTALSLTLSGLT